MAAHKDDIALSFYDSLLKRSDVELLNEGYWLNDQVIGFVFEYFEREQFKDISDDVLFVNPDVTQFIKLGQGPELGPFLEPLNLASRTMVFFAVNDNESRLSTGGMHWSLLVYNKIKNIFCHYDSFGSTNTAAARKLCTNVQSFLNAKESPTFTEPVCPQQQNCSDCGVFVVCLAEQICRQEYFGERRQLNELVTQDKVREKRESLKELINSLGSLQEKP